MSDGLSYASKHYDPEYILDFATLTGAVVVALGHIATGVMGTNEDLMKKVKASSKILLKKFGNYHFGMNIVNKFKVILRM